MATQTEYPNGAVIYDNTPLHQKTIILDNSAILDLEETYPTVITPTEFFNYSGYPTTLPIPVSAQGILNTSFGAYTNGSAPTDTCSLKLVWGSDWSLEVSSVWDAEANAPLNLAAIFGVSQSRAGLSFYSGSIWDNQFSIDSFQDNGLYLALSNTAGNLEDGGEGNYLRISISFLLYQTETGLYI